MAKLPVLSWVLYDFANTVFSYVVLTRYFTEWVVIERGRPDWVIGVMSVCVAGALVLTLPFLGALADRLGRHAPLLRLFTAVSVTGTALLGLVDDVTLALVVAGVAIFAFNAAEAQYHPLLASVAPPERRNRVSGLAVGVGYVGALVALVGLDRVVEDGANQDAFLPAAIVFGAFALPCLLFVPERPGRGTSRADGAGARRGLARQALADLSRSVRAARGRPHGRFLLARFLYVDAIATVIAFMTVYARRTGGFSGGELTALLALATVCAILGAVAAGVVAERVGPKRVVVATLLAVTATLLLTAVSGSGAILWLAGPLVGAALGSVTATDRVWMLRLVPAESRGEGFGLYALVGKVSNGFGPLVLWGGTILLLSEVLAVASPLGASRVAIGVLALAALLGAWLLRGVPERVAEGIEVYATEPVTIR